MALRDTLVWIDLEMTGLDPDRDRILEIATIVTDSALNVLAERVRASDVDEAQAERQTLAFLAQWSEPGSSPMCGNSIGQDRRFLARHMRALETFFHYRNIDVSTVKELARRWRPDVLAGVKKEGAHLALDDIRESIAELRHYRDAFFRLES